MERKLLTILMLAAFATNASDGSSIDPNLPAEEVSRIANSLGGGADSLKRFLPVWALKAYEKISQSIAAQEAAAQEAAAQEAAQVVAQAAQEAAAEKAAQIVAQAAQEAAEKARQAGWDGYVQAVQQAAHDATLTAKGRALAGKAWKATKSGLAKGKNAVVGIPSAVVNTTFGGIMQSLAGDYAAITAGVTGSGLPVGAAQVFGVRQLLGNVCNNKIATLKVAAATAAATYGAVKGATWVTGKAKSAYQARLAKLEAAAKEKKNNGMAVVSGEGASAPTSAETSADAAPVVEISPVVVQDPMNAVLVKLHSGQPLNDADGSVVESAFGAFWIEAMPLEQNQHKVRKAFMFGKCKISVNTDQHRVMNSIICDTKKPQAPVKPLPKPELTPAPAVVTVKPVTPASTEVVDASAKEQPAVGRTLMDRARSLAGRWWKTSAALEDATTTTTTTTTSAAAVPTTTVTATPVVKQASRWGTWWPRSSKTPATVETAEQTAARLSKEKAAREEAATQANQRPMYEFTGR